jgi:hypothetical protein
MKYAALTAAILVLIAVIPAVSSGCGESAEEAETSAIEPGLPTTTDSPSQTPAPWQADGVLGDDEYLGEMSYGDFEVRWTSDEQNVYFGIKARTEGWVSIGLKPSSGMKDADIILGMVSEGQAVIYDYFSTGEFGPHLPDTELGGSYDIIEFGGSETGGITTIEFSRALVTGDSYDHDLAEGTIQIIWAYGSADETDQRHTSRGSGEITL